MTSLPFRFDAERHEYTALDTGEELPHITGLLKASGWVDDTFFTEDSCERGRAVHSLTADFDLGALEPAGCVSRYRGYLLGYAKAVSIIRPKFRHIEVAMVHAVLRFGGRPDRAADDFYQTIAVAEIKSGAPHKSHLIQTALQAILVAPDFNLPPEAVQRFALYPTRAGRCKVERHVRRQDFDEAFRILRRYAQ